MPWVTKTGEVIAIKNMTDAHLLNTINYLYRKSRKSAADLPFPTFSGAEAQMEAERGYYLITEFPDVLLPREFLTMVRAAKKRKLALSEDVLTAFLSLTQEL